MVKQLDKDWLPILDPIVRKAGNIVMDYYGTDLKQTGKEDHSFFTPADVASEQYLKQELASLIPEAQIIAEESGATENAEYCWVIDPLDGTNNFARNINYFCISVALVFNEQPIVGVVFDPVHNDLFFAQIGRGAVLNGVPIRVSQCPDSRDALRDTLIVLGLPYKKEARLALMRAADQMALQAAGIRYMGAAALDLAYVACGRIDALALSNLYWWDVAAGILLIQEAGGVVTDIDGLAVGPGYTFCLAGGRAVQAELRDIMKKVTLS